MVRPLKLQKSYEVVFSPTSSFLVSLGQDVVVWDVILRKKRFRVHPFSHPSHCDIHPSETFIAIKNTAGQIILIDSKIGAVKRVLDRGQNGEGSNIGFSPCGDYLIDASWDGDLIIRETKTGAAKFKQRFPNEMITQVILNAAKNQWIIVHSPKATDPDKPPSPAYLSVWSWPGFKRIKKLSTGQDSIDYASVSPDGSKLCTISREEITIFQIPTYSVLASAPFVFGGTGFSISWSIDSTEIATVQQDSVTFHSSSDLRELAKVQLEYACDVKYAPTGSLIALGSWKNGLLIERSPTLQQ